MHVSEKTITQTGSSPAGMTVYIKRSLRNLITLVNDTSVICIMILCVFAPKYGNAQPDLAGALIATVFEVQIKHTLYTLYYHTINRTCNTKN